MIWKTVRALFPEENASPIIAILKGIIIII